MATFAYDIELDPDLQELLTPPDCPTISLPKLGKAELCLPLGGKFQGLVDARNTIPDDCSLNFSLLLQLPPLMASLECVIKILKLIKPLLDLFEAIKTLDVLKIPNAVADFAKAAADVVNTCVAQILIGPPLFVKDLILLIAKLLHCIGDTLHSIAQLMGGLSISIAAAKADGNDALLQQLNCAMENAQSQADAAMGQMDVIQAVLLLAQPFFALTPGAPKIVIPTFGSAADAEAMDSVATAVMQLSAALIKVANAMPGSC